MTMLLDEPEDSQIIGFRDADFAWAIEDGNVRSDFRLHIDGELFFKRNGINLIIGPT